MNKTTEFKIGDNVQFGKYSVGIYRGKTTSGLAKVEIGIDLLTNPDCPQPLIAIVPEDELTLDN